MLHRTVNIDQMCSGKEFLSNYRRDAPTGRLKALLHENGWGANAKCVVYDINVKSCYDREGVEVTEINLEILTLHLREYRQNCPGGFQTFLGLLCDRRRSLMRGDRTFPSHTTTFRLSWFSQKTRG